MRLHRLALQAFGPFPGRVEVDFDALGASGLFLVHGPTGAGKTTVLDAVCFALYAAVPGARPGGRSLRSDHADPTTAARVELDFTAAGRRLHVTRSPEFSRPKQRGTGTTIVPATVLLRERRGGQWTPVSTRADEVGALVRDVLGLGLEQFATVVLLPQGDFAAFLRASPETRRDLLERLFDVARFTAVEAALAERRRAATAALGDAEAQLAQQLRRAGDVLARVPAGPVPAPDWDASPVAQLPAALTRLATDVQTLATGALVDRDTAEAAERSTRADLDTAERTAAARARGGAARAALTALADRAPALAATADALAAGRAAASVAGDARALTDAAARCAAAGNAADAAVTAASDAGLPATADLPAARALAGAVGQWDGPLAEAAHLAGVLAAAAERRRRAQQALAGAHAEHTAALAVAGERAAAVAHTAAAHAGAARHAPDVAAAAAQVSELAARLRWRRELTDCEEALRRAQDRQRATTGAFLDARARSLDARSAHLDAIAARLAADLTDGVPCPVCGSPEHPRPADSAAGVPDAAVADAEATLTRASEQRSAADTDVARLDGHAGALRAQLGAEHRDAATLAGLLAAATDRHDAARAHVHSLAALEEAAAAARAHLDEHRARCERTGAAERAAAARLDALTAEAARTDAALTERLDRHAQRCPCASGQRTKKADGPAGTGVADVQARHRRVAGVLEQLTVALTALARAQQEAAATGSAVNPRLAAAGFASVGDVAAATLPPAVLAAHEHTLAAAERDRVAAATVLADPQVSAAVDAQPADLPALRAAAAAAARARQDAERRHAVTDLCARELATVAAAVSTAAASVTDRSQQQRRTARLADTVNGLGADNTLRMRLSSFVLAARLERVVDLANERLGRLGDGRYQLRHTDARVPGTGRSGLGLAVEDRWTGRTRAAATLSGGETFLASLALALGLADAVRAEAGGFDLATLFVDEGFGTLDEDSLEQVLGVLDRLRDGGRAVGVVSHVADLRARIPDQLRVEKRPGGSTLAVVQAAATSM